MRVRFFLFLEMLDLMQKPQKKYGLLLGFGVSCVECQSDSEPLCVRLVVERLVADDTGVVLSRLSRRHSASAECTE